MQKTELDIVKRISSLYAAPAAPREGGGKWTVEEEDLARQYFVAEQKDDAFWETHFKGKRTPSAMKTYIQTYIAPLRKGAESEVPAAVRTLKQKLQGMAKDDVERVNVGDYCMKIANFLISDEAPRKRARKEEVKEEAGEKMDVEKDGSVFSL